MICGRDDRVDNPNASTGAGYAWLSGDDGGLNCPRNSYILDTDYWSKAFSYDWDWDYWVDGGEWVVWDGGVRVGPDSGYIPHPGYPDPGAPGYNNLSIHVGNWRMFSPRGDSGIDARLFMICGLLHDRGQGASGRAEPPLQPLSVAGDEGDDTLRGDEDENALIGRGGADRLIGDDGRDYLRAGSGDDSMLAGSHDDLLHGFGGDDLAHGGSGDDAVLGAAGDDRAFGGDGDDQLFDTEGTDVLSGGPGNDRFSARDGDRDVIRCGPGRDIVVADRLDVLTGCERVLPATR